MFQHMKAKKVCRFKKNYIKENMVYYINATYICLYFAVIHEWNSFRVSEKPSSKHSTIERELRKSGTSQVSREHHQRHIKNFLLFFALR